MRSFVTGATGFIGSAVVRTLVERQHEVVALVREASIRPVELFSKVEIVVGDMLILESFRKAAQTADAIIHAAQLRFPGRVTGPFVRDAETADATAVEHLFHIARDNKGLKRFIYTSGCWVYGDRGNQLLSEKSGFQPTRLAQGHHHTGQKLLDRYRGEGFPAVVLTPGMVYGPGGPFLSMIQALDKGQLRKIGGGRSFWSPVHIEDVAMAYALAVERSKPGEFYNVVDDNPLLAGEFLDIMCRCMQRLPLGSAPKFLARIFMGRLLVDSLTASFRVSNHKIRSELGWRPRYASVREGLPPVVAELTRQPPIVTSGPHRPPIKN